MINLLYIIFRNIFINIIKNLYLYTIIGVGGGVLGATFNIIWYEVNKRRKRWYIYLNGIKKSSCVGFKLAEVAIVSLITSYLSFYLPLYFDWACKPTVSHDAEGTKLSIDGTYSYPFQFNCNDGETNQIATILFGSRGEKLKSK